MRSCLAPILVATGLVLGGRSLDLQTGGVAVTPACDAARCAALASEIGLTLQVHQTAPFLVLSWADDTSATVTGQFPDQVHLRFTHELTHQLAFNSGPQRRGATYPFWLAAGMATNFEADSPDSLGRGGEDIRLCASMYRTFSVADQHCWRTASGRSFAGGFPTEMP